MKPNSHLDLERLAQRLTGAPVTRFAPSPTGYLHLGHVVNAIYVWGIARALRGRVLLRIEDHDRLRSRPAFEAAILDDLDWLGFVADEGRDPVLRQSDTPAVYEEALALLRHDHHAYACRCSRKNTARERYGGHCRDRRLPETAGMGIRVQIEAGSVCVEDWLLGRMVQVPESQCGDLLLRDRDGHWTYQFAVTVDDFRQGVTLVIRGEDLADSTGRQVRLARMMGRSTPPEFVHHPLILGPDGAKLSKSDGDTSVRELRKAGVTAPELIGRAAAAVGLTEATRLNASDVPSLFGTRNALSP